jgi:hypothetical protein
MLDRSIVTLKQCISSSSSNSSNNQSIQQQPIGCSSSLFIPLMEHCNDAPFFLYNAIDDRRMLRTYWDYWRADSRLYRDEVEHEAAKEQQTKSIIYNTYKVVNIYILLQQQQYHIC